MVHITTIEEPEKCVSFFFAFAVDYFIVSRMILSRSISSFSVQAPPPVFRRRSFCFAITPDRISPMLMIFFFSPSIAQPYRHKDALPERRAWLCIRGVHVTTKECNTSPGHALSSGFDKPHPTFRKPFPVPFALNPPNHSLPLSCYGSIIHIAGAMAAPILLASVMPKSMILPTVAWAMRAP